MRQNLLNNNRGPVTSKVCFECITDLSPEDTADRPGGEKCTGLFSQRGRTSVCIMCHRIPVFVSQLDRAGVVGRVCVSLQLFRLLQELLDWTRF